ncbi:GGDEF domain-containing protein [Sphingomonas sp. RS2018]
MTAAQIRLTDWWRGAKPTSAPTAAPREIARRTLMDDIGNFLSTHDLSVTPHNLRIAQEQMVGHPPTVSAIAALLREHGRLTDDLLAQIVPPVDGIPPALVSDVAGALAARLEEALSIVAQSQESARGYGAALDQQMRVAANDPVGALDRLIPLTRDVVEATREMEGRLENARRETDALRAKVESARRDADCDHLTGLPNRRWFDTRMAALDPDCGATVAICDIDDFKSVNDRHGHDAGDRVLRFFAKLLRSDLARYAEVARYGGEEFVCLFENCTPQQAYERLDAVRGHLARRSLVNQDTGESIGTITFSAGLATMGGDRRGAIRVADDALYRAKRSGKDCLVVG